MQARSNLNGNESMRQAFHDIFRQEGVAGLWRVSNEYSNLMGESNRELSAVE